MKRDMYASVSFVICKVRTSEYMYTIFRTKCYSWTDDFSYMQSCTNCSTVHVRHMRKPRRDFSWMKKTVGKW